LPRNIDLNILLQKVTFKSAKYFESRLLMSTFRVYAVDPDWLSTLPDLYMFGSIDHLETMWSTTGFDASCDYNMPSLMKTELGLHCYENLKNIERFYNPHAELWSLYREKLISISGSCNVTLQQAASEMFFLDDHRLHSMFWNAFPGRRSIEKSNFPSFPFVADRCIGIPKRSPSSYNLRLWYKPRPVEKLVARCNYFRNTFIERLPGWIWKY